VGGSGHTELVALGVGHDDAPTDRLVLRATPWPLRRRGVEHAAEHARDPRSLAARRHFWEDTLILVSVTSWGDPNCVSLDMTQRVDLASVLDWLESEFGLAPPA
jgi:hypothetical protein